MTIEIPLSQGQIALIDDDDFELVSQYIWYAGWNPNTKSFYACTNIRKLDGKYTILHMHKLITGFRITNPKNHDTLDNRRENLRDASASQNQGNMRPRGGSSQYKGVSWRKKSKKWTAQIQINKKLKHLGYFTEELEAAKAYDTAALQAWGEFAYLNF